MQPIATPLLPVVTAYARIPRIKAFISWLKNEASDTNYAQVGVSQIGGNDIIKGDNSVLVNAELFDYVDESSHVLRYDYERSIQEPRGGVSYALGDVLLSNITRRFTPDFNATIGTALESRRPIKMLVGFETNGGGVRSVQTLVGLTEDRPKANYANRTVDLQVYDYITYLNNQTVSAAIYENKRMDEIVEEILADLGFGSSQYVLDQGINTIEFAWFDKNKSAGQRIRELCEAEEATFYQDENGILRLENRNHVSTAPHNQVQHTIDPNDIMYYEGASSTQIINRAIVRAKPRKIDSSYSEVWSNSVVEEVPAGETITIWATFYDEQAGRDILPIKDIAAPVANTDFTANSQDDGGGSDLSGDVSITITNFVESAKIEIENTGGSTVYLTSLRLLGKAARVKQAIEIVREDAVSIGKFEPKEYVVENNLIQDPAVAEAIADNLVAKYSNPMGRVDVKIPAIPHLQLKDLLKVSNPYAQNLIRNPSFELNTSYWEVEKPAGTTATLSKVFATDAPQGASVARVVIS